ncbi:MAG TPA: radical SAM protein, partial [Candidatus Limnocylindria bacterium]|nr:radical SAM protein [Candidatus Limnocylindria bacterium]
LETTHPEVLAKLNKRMTTDDFARAAAFLRGHGMEVRVFLLVKPPFLDSSAALEWAMRSVEFAFACGANVVSLIPTRFGNGALEELARSGDFTPPSLSLFEDAVDAAFAGAHGRGRVFADLWDLGRFCDNPTIFTGRHARLTEMNLRQIVLPRVPSA